jgi:hypothetical protein
VWDNVASAFWLAILAVVAIASLVAICVGLVWMWAIT